MRNSVATVGWGMGMGGVGGGGQADRPATEGLVCQLTNLHASPHPSNE